MSPSQIYCGMPSQIVGSLSCCFRYTKLIFISV
jgi:hypothetical protein